MKASISKQQGFTIIEVMIAVVLSSIVLLGLAVGEIKSLQYATNSFNYTVSLVQANNAIERTWSNLCSLQQALPFDAAYGTNNFQTQANVYTLTTDPAVGEAFSNKLDVTVSWLDARMADNYSSTVRIKATYLQIC